MSQISLLFSHIAAYAAQASSESNYEVLVITGFAAIRSGNVQKASQLFTKALNIDRNRYEAHLGLGMVALQAHHNDTAAKYLNQAYKLNKKDSMVLISLGELAYRQDNFKEAIKYWEKAQKLAPLDPNILQRLQRLKREYRTEKEFNQSRGSHFRLKYSGRETKRAGQLVLRILNQAYNDVGRKLDTYPLYDIQVICYTDEQFRDVTQASSWVGALYDGKIRVPTKGLEYTSEQLRRMLYHEYTHALVHSLARTCPTWLNEGLAQYIEGKELGRTGKEYLAQVVTQPDFPSLRTLEGSFMGLSPLQAEIVYMVSLSAVQFWIDRFGLFSIRALLNRLKNGEPFENAMNNELAVSYSTFERRWKESLNSQ